MSISPPSTCRSSKKGPGSFFAGDVEKGARPLFLALFLFLQTSLSMPFLDLFAQRDGGALTERSFQLDAGARQIPAYLVRPAAPGKLPAILLASGREGLTDSLRRFAREIAGLGYATLAVDYRGDHNMNGSPLLKEILGSAGDLDAAAGWLAAQPGIDPDRLGALGWNDAFDAVNVLAQRGKVAAAYRSPIESQMAMSEQAWVDIYEFFGKHVEDVRVADMPARPDAPFARIVDIMRAINSDQGVRGRLARSLAAPPADAAAWEQARSDAAMIAEAGNLLLARQPPKGSAAGWRQRAADFRAAAQTLLRAMERRDFSAAQQSLRELPQTCAACHAEYR